MSEFENLESDWEMTVFPQPNAPGIAVVPPRRKDSSRRKMPPVFSAKEFLKIWMILPLHEKLGKIRYLGRMEKARQAHVGQWGAENRKVACPPRDEDFAPATFGPLCASSSARRTWGQARDRRSCRDPQAQWKPLRPLPTFRIVNNQYL